MSSVVDDIPHSLLADNEATCRQGEQAIDPNQRSVVLAVAAYSSKAAAQRDFEAARRHREAVEGREGLTVALLEKGADGSLRVDGAFGDEPGLALWRRALLGAMLVVIAPPLGLVALASIVSDPADWVGASRMVSQFWRRVSRAQLFQMSLQTEAGQAALMVVALDAASLEVGSLTRRAASAVVTEVAAMDLQQTFLQGT
jgi:hypothetical protein